MTEVVAPSANTPYARVKMEFENPGPKPCRFERYAVSWGSARKEITLEDLLIPAGERRERWLKVHPEDGDLGALSKDARVEVKTRCE